MATVKTYYQLAKPGIVYGNVISVLAGFFYGLTLASFKLVPLVAVVLGTALVMGGACVLNNITDRFIDAHMERTKKRALVIGAITVRQAAIFASLLLIAGFLILAKTNLLTALIGLVGVIDYVLLYAWAKRATPLGTVVGTVSGSVPLLAGYTALTGAMTQSALVLFFMMVFWQMAHFYAIAIYRQSDYKAAHIPVLPVSRGVAETRQQILVFVVLFLLSAIYMVYKNFVPLWYGIVIAAVCGLWIQKTLQPLGKEQTAWAKRNFKFSLIVLLVFCAATSFVGVIDYFWP